MEMFHCGSVGFCTQLITLQFVQIWLSTPGTIFRWMQSPDKVEVKGDFMLTGLRNPKTASDPAASGFYMQ